MNDNCKEEDSYNRILKYTGLFGGIQGLVTLINVVKTKIVSSLLGSTGIGINETFNRTLNLVKSTTDLGIAFSAVRGISESVEVQDAGKLEYNILVVRSWAFLTAAAGTLLCFLLSGLFSHIAFESDTSYTLSFMLLSPVVGLAAIQGAEMAILKGVRCLDKIALAQLITVILTFLITVPLIWIMGLMGLVPVLVAVQLAQTAVICRYSFKICPYKLKLFSKSVMRDGFGMIRLGVFFTLAAFFGAGAFSVIAFVMINRGNAEIAGVYGAGYLLVQYLGMFVFSAMETDYFPRLSSVNYDFGRVSQLVNSQMEVASLLVSPLVIAFLVGLPIIVPLFLSRAFVDSIPMAQFAVLSLCFKAMTQPAAYISLSKGDSKTFLIQEFFFDLFMVASVVLCFLWGGVKFAGAAVALSGLFDMMLVWTITHKRYGFSPSSRALKVFFYQLPSIAGAYLFSVSASGLVYWTGGAVCGLVSVAVSLHYLQKNTSFLHSFISKIKNRLGL